MEVINYEIVDSQGQTVGSMELDAAVFGAAINQHLVFEEVRWQLLRRRAGTHACLSKGVMKGGGRKPWRQKGTGRARCGSNTSPLWVGGAVAHGPKPRKYGGRISKRSRRLALQAALTAKVRDKGLVILDRLELQGGKTRELQGLLRDVGVTAGRVAVILPPGAEPGGGNISRAGRNLERVITLPVDGLNAYDLLRCRYLVSTREGIAAVQAALSAGTQGEAAGFGVKAAKAEG